MGGHYGSTQLRTTDRPAVLAAADAVCRERGIKCLVGPALNGWVGVYPEGHGQDHTVGEQLAARVGGHVLHLLVHDDDVLAYWLWLDGQLVDRYWSKPGYFGLKNLAEEELLIGDPEQFALVLDVPARQKLRKLLDRNDRPVMESRSLESVGRLLRLRSVVEAFEYLTEEDQPEGTRRRFTEVPIDVEAEATRAAENAAERKRRSAVESASRNGRKRLIAEGLLLATEARDGWYAPSLAAIRGGCAVGWSSYHPWPSHVKLHTSMQEGTQDVRELALPPDVQVALTCSADGQRLATLIGETVRIWDLGTDSEWRHSADLPLKDRFDSATLSPDGLTLAVARSHEVIGIDVSTGRRVIAVDAFERGPLAFDSEGSTLAQIGRGVRLTEDLHGEPKVRDLFVGGIRRDFAAASREALARVMVARKLQLPANYAAGLSPTAPPHSVDNVHCVGFSRDQKWMWCGTDTGLLVFDRATLPIGGGPISNPSLRFDLPHSLPPTSTAVLATVEDPAESSVLCGGGDGRVYRMNLETNEFERLLTLPSKGCCIVNLCLTADRSALIVASSQPRQPTSARPSGSVLTVDIWAYGRLLPKI